jgi:hypothetical protein
MVGELHASLILLLVENEVADTVHAERIGIRTSLSQMARLFARTLASGRFAALLTLATLLLTLATLLLLTGLVHFIVWIGHWGALL